MLQVCQVYRGHLRPGCLRWSAPVSAVLRGEKLSRILQIYILESATRTATGAVPWILTVRTNLAHHDSPYMFTHIPIIHIPKDLSRGKFTLFHVYPPLMFTGPPLRSHPFSRLLHPPGRELQGLAHECLDLDDFPLSAPSIWQRNRAIKSGKAIWQPFLAVKFDRTD